MNTESIRKQIHEYIDHEADDRFVNLIYAMIVAETNPIDYLPEAVKNDLMERVERHKNGKSENHTWEEVKAHLLNR